MRSQRLEVVGAPAARVHQVARVVRRRERARRVIVVVRQLAATAAARTLSGLLAASPAGNPVHKGCRAHSQAQSKDLQKAFIGM
eukprot:8534548-Pyramimonas_sp.AAC.1